MAFNLGQMLQGGANSGTYTPETVARKQKMAEALLGKSMGIQNIEHPLQGLAQMLQAGISGYRLKEADEIEASERERANKALGELLGQGTEADIGALMSAAGDPWTSDANARMAQILMGENIRRNDPAYQMGLEKMGLELEGMRNPGPGKPIEVGGVLLDPETYQPIFDSREAASPKPMEINGQLVDPATGNIIGDYRDQPDPGFRLLPREEAAGMGLDPSKAWQAGPDNRVYEVGGGGVNVSVGGEGQRMGTIPAGMAAVEDPSNPSGFRLEPIPGGPAAQEAAARLASQEAAGQQQERYANVVSEDIDRAVSLLKADPLLSTGPFGQILGNISGTSANRLDSMLSTIRANTSFDRLQAMRAASPTGGALGAVSDTELRLLQNSIGALERSNPEDLEYNLRRVQRIYDEIVNGPEGQVQNASQPSPSAPAAPAAGTIEDGYRFKGGDPADPNSWEKVN